MKTRIYGRRWKIIRTVSEGGQGQVFEVEDKQGGPNRALKRLMNVKRLDRFEAELAAIQRLNHPNVIKLVDHDLRGERPYLVVELIPSGSLEEHLVTVSSDPQLALMLFEGICEGVAAAHAARIVHRDLKPANILLKGPRGPAVVTDFGICHIGDGERLTLTEEAVGPRLYMAPELEDGRAEEVRPASDVYSLGKILWSMLAGRHVFAREKHRVPVYSLVERLEGLAEPVNDLLDKMITLSPEDRLQDAAEVVERVKRIAQAAKITTLWKADDHEALKGVYDTFPEWHEPWRDPGARHRGKDKAPTIPFTRRTTEMGVADDVRAAASQLGIKPVGQVQYALGSFSHRRDITENVWCWLDAPTIEAWIAKAKRRRKTRP